MSIIDNSDTDISLLNNDVFIEACKNDNIELIKKIYQLKDWIFNIKDETDIYTEEDALCFCCRNGYLNVVKYICSTNTVDIHEKKEEPFTLACQCNHLDIAKFLYDIDPSIDIYVDSCNPFALACKFNNLEVVKWLIDIEPSVLDSEEFPDYFTESCENGSIETIKYILSVKEDLFTRIDAKELIKTVSYTSNQDVLKWLLEKVSISNSDIIDSTFTSACFKGNINIVKYLISIYKDVENDYENIAKLSFNIACKQSDWEIVNFIRTSYSKINFLEDQQCFKNACLNGDIEIASNLLLLNPELNDQTDINDIFYRICSYNKLEMAKWYLNLNQDINIEDYSIDSVIANENLEMIKWITSIKPNLINEEKIQNLLSGAFRYSNIDIIKYLLDYSKDYFDLQSNFYQSEYLISVCFLSYDRDVMKWLCDNYEIPQDYIEDNLDDIIDSLLENGNYEIIMILYKKYPNIYNISSKSFNVRIYKESEAINYFEWLFEQKPDIDFTEDLNYLISKFLGDEDIRVTNYLLGKIKNYSEILNLKSIFIDSCIYRNFDTVKFIKNKFGISDDLLRDAFIESIDYCKHNLKIIKWLFSFKEDKDFYRNLKLDRFTRGIESRSYISSELMDWLIFNQFKDIEISKACFKSDVFISNHNFAFELIDSGKIEMNFEVYETAMESACSHNNFTLFKEILKREPALVNEKMITKVIDCEQFEMLKLLVNKENIDEIAKSKSFTKYCSRKKSNVKIIDYFFSLEPEELCFNTFQYFILVSDISFIKQLYNKFSNIRNIKNNKIHIKFIFEAFSKGKLEIAKWYLEVNPDINFNIKGLLNCSSKNGKIESVLHLISHYKVENLETIYSCFYNFCLFDFKDEAEKLLKFKPEIEDLIEVNKLFSELINKNSFNSIILLIKLRPEFDVRFDNDSLFKSAVNQNNVELAKYLTETYPSVYYIEIDDFNSIIDYCIFQKIDQLINKKELEKDVEDCYICGEISDVYTSCKHFYCENCILSWIVKKKSDYTNSTCPYCRENMNVNNLFKIIE